MADDFKFETFVDAHSNIFQEYLSSVIAKLRKNNLKYCEIREKISSICEQYPAVLDAVDLEKSSDLTKDECKALIKIMELRNEQHDMELGAVYFRGCYDSVGYLKKAGIL